MHEFDRLSVKANRLYSKAGAKFSTARVELDLASFASKVVEICSAISPQSMG